MNEGCKRSKRDIRDYKFKPIKVSADYPETYKLSMPKPKTQVGPTCVANALALIVEYYVAKQLNYTATMSTGYIYGNRRNTTYKGSGMALREAVKAVMADGTCTQNRFPYTLDVPDAIAKFEEKYEEVKGWAEPHHFNGYVIAKSKDEIKHALTLGYPVIFSILTYDDQGLDGNYIWKSTRDPSLLHGAHCMVIYGWNKDGWMVQNSWGRNWGNKGCFILPYDFPIEEGYGIIDTYKEDVDKPFKSKIGDIFAKIVNFFWNLFRKK